MRQVQIAKAPGEGKRARRVRALATLLRYEGTHAGRSHCGGVAGGFEHLHDHGLVRPSALQGLVAPDRHRALLGPRLLRVCRAGARQPDRLPGPVRLPTESDAGNDHAPRLRALRPPVARRGADAALPRLVRARVRRGAGGVRLTPPTPTGLRDVVAPTRVPPMRIRTLGRSGLRVSEICLGTMTFG